MGCDYRDDETGMCANPFCKSSRNHERCPFIGNEHECGNNIIQEEDYAGIYEEFFQH